MERMEFPNTFDEFAKDYGFKDKKEVYTNGSDLIPVFRVKQWLEHIEQKPCDCISRKEALKELGEAPYVWTDCDAELQAYEDWRTIKEMLEGLPSVAPKEPKWISVSERLPEDEQEVLVCSNNGNMEVTCGSRSTEIKGQFIWYTSGWKFGEVIAWHPLPKPYIESEE